MLVAGVSARLELLLLLLACAAAGTALLLRSPGLHTP
jgi:hypothetical protein